MQILNEVDPDLGTTDMFGAKGIDPISQINRTGLGNHIAMTSSLDDAAKSPPFNLRSGDLNAIRNRSDVQQGIQLGASVLAGPVMELILPELGVAKDMAHIAGKAVDVYDGMRELTGPSDRETFDSAYQQALFDQLNRMTVQRSLSASTPPAARGLIP